MVTNDLQTLNLFRLLTFPDELFCSHYHFTLTENAQSGNSSNYGNFVMKTLHITVPLLFHFYYCQLLFQLVSQILVTRLSLKLIPHDC